MSEPKTELTDGGPVPADGAHAQLRADGQQKGYVVLSPEERAKGFVRPVRRTYLHVGMRPQHPLRDLTPDEQERHKGFGYVKFEAYPDAETTGALGRYWTEKQLTSGCGAATTMGRSLAETYARDPKFYGGTFCVKCGAHYPVGEHGEFVWEDGSRVGT